MAGGYLAALAWILSLALIDGWSRGLATQLTPQAEYLHDVPKVTGIPAMISGFASHILDFRPGSWATHVAGPVTPGALLVFAILDRIGLGGGGPAGWSATGRPVSGPAGSNRRPTRSTSRVDGCGSASGPPSG